MRCGMTEKIPGRGRRRLVRVIIFCAICVSLNIGLSLITSYLGFPLYLDSIGTVLAAVVCGILPGMGVGLITNFIKCIFDYSSIYYGSLNVIIALIAALMTNKGYVKKLWGKILLIFELALAGGFLGSIITWFLFGFATEGISASFAEWFYTKLEFARFPAQVTADYIIDLADKAITVIVVFLIICFMPERIKSRLRFVGWQQNPLNEYQISRIKKGKNRKGSLRTRILMLAGAGTLLVGIFATTIGYILFQASIIEDHTTLGLSVSKLAASSVNGDYVDSFIEKGEDAAGYLKTERTLAQIRESSPDIEYIYVYKIEEDGCHVVFDLDTEEMEGSEPGDLIDFDESFRPYIQDLLDGKEIDPIISDDSYGWLLTAYSPVYDSRGQVVCYAAADISMNDLREQCYAYLTKQISLFLGFFIFVLSIGLKFAQYNILYPVNSMALTASMFAEDDEKNIHGMNRIAGLNIHTGDEIENLYNALSKTTSDVIQYVEDIKTHTETISRMQTGLIMVLADMVESRDHSTGAHIRKTAAYVNIILTELKAEGKFPDIITDEYISNVTSAAPLHDIGKIKISDLILNKPGKFTDEEYEIMKKHTVYGAEIIRQSIETVTEAGYMVEAAKMAEGHHELWNGKGYPHGLKGDEIPLSARVMTVADVFDALVSKRVYKSSFSFEDAMKMIVDDKGERYDPDVVDAFVAAKDQVRKVAEDFEKKENGEG